MLAPHGIQIATKGILAITLGTTSKGYLVRITETIPEIPVVPPTQGGPAKSGFRLEEEERKKRKIVYICVEAYGKKFLHEEVVFKDRKIDVGDIEITEIGNEEIIITVDIDN